MESRTTRDADLRAIETINQQDMQFALANDPDKMMSQWADDIVLLQPAGPIMRGRNAIAQAFQGVERPEIVEYELLMQEVTISGDYAFQWGTYQYGMRPRTGGDTVRTSGKLMRVLQRQTDGSWKIYRGISTMDPPAQ